VVDGRGPGDGSGDLELVRSIGCGSGGGTGTGGNARDGVAGYGVDEPDDEGAYPPRNDDDGPNVLVPNEGVIGVIGADA